MSSISEISEGSLFPRCQCSSPLGFGFVDRISHRLFSRFSLAGARAGTYCPGTDSTAAVRMGLSAACSLAKYPHVPVRYHLSAPLGPCTFTESYLWQPYSILFHFRPLPGPDYTHYKVKSSTCHVLILNPLTKRFLYFITQNSRTPSISSRVNSFVWGRFLGLFRPGARLTNEHQALLSPVAVGHA